ncbi:MAG TPA: phenylalanine--tRNA ligase subunit beta [Negativicutes bacterium]|nr:phenylalanine--tRNA ligase subunit beta [Negativicutes bacterium]
MRAPVRWLKDYVTFEDAPEVMGERLTMAGIPVEGIDRPCLGLKNIVTGLIRSVDPHPNADRLSVCMLDLGGRIVKIVTAATNVRAGQIVPVALADAILADGTVIQPTDFRGVASEGMLCSCEEILGDTKIIAPEKREGIYILPSDTPLGQDIRPVMGLDDVTMEFELTANRADCFSVLGIAREIGVLTGNKAKRPLLTLQEKGQGKASDMASIEIRDPELCKRFCARILTNVRMGESPLWMQHRLQAAGMRPISNVVDVTNFVMLELGQPMHAYDYSLLAKHSIVVRRAATGEKLTTLDGSKRELNSEMLVIADALQPVGIAGVMGGLATEVSASTRTVLLEAAAFYGPSIRRTSRGLGLRSEASGRFERGVDVAAIPLAINRAAQLLEEMGACDVVPGIIDVYPNAVLPAQFDFTAAWINRYLGSDIPAATMLEILEKLEFSVKTTGDVISVIAPTWRQDVTGSVDIAEEVSRIFGYDNIPSTRPEGPLQAGGVAAGRGIMDTARDLMSGFGFYETLSFSFSHPAFFDHLRLPADSPLRNAIPIMNPITDEFPILRTTLMAGLLDTVARNLARKNEELRLYEVGTTHHAKSLPLTSHPEERYRLCGVMVGRRDGTEWCHSRENVDFYDVKGIVESLLTGLGAAQWQVGISKAPWLHPGKQADFIVDDVTIATIGALHPSVQESFGISRPVYIFKVNLSELNALCVADSRTYAPLPKYPAINRDLAIVLSDSISAAEVMAQVQIDGGPLLVDAHLFDVYTGDRVEKGTRSLAISLVYRANERTLTDEEVEGPFRSLIGKLEAKFEAKLRS